MPKTKTAKKALRQSKRRYLRNNVRKEDLKNTIKKFKKLVAAGNIAGAKEQLRAVSKKLDKTAKAGLIKKNKASRLKSRFSRLLNKTSA